MKEVGFSACLIADIVVLISTIKNVLSGFGETGNIFLALFFPSQLQSEFLSSKWFIAVLIALGLVFLMLYILYIIENDGVKRVLMIATGIVTALSLILSAFFHSSDAIVVIFGLSTVCLALFIKDCRFSRYYMFWLVSLVWAFFGAWVFVAIVGLAVLKLICGILTSICSSGGDKTPRVKVDVVHHYDDSWY